MSASGIKCGDRTKVRKVLPGGDSKETARGKEHFDDYPYFYFPGLLAACTVLVEFIHPSNSYLSNICQVPGTAVGAGGIVMSSTVRVPASILTVHSGEGAIINTISSSEVS